MYRSHTCGELRISDVNKEVTLAGWVQTVRKFGAITFVDLRDRYGITQLLFGEELNPTGCAAIGKGICIAGNRYCF
jgi:aspartyl-tRNA synthetase